MSTNSLCDEEGDSVVSETEFPSKPGESQAQIEKKIYVKPGRFWGDMSKYTDEDFDPRISRLKIAKNVSFHKRSVLKNTNFLAKLKIRNTSNLPMTYNVTGSAVQKFKISQSPDWIPPHTDGVVEIRIQKNLAQDKSELVLDLLKESFIVFATPIFREEHAQKAKLELYWRAFGQARFPYYHAEYHFVTLNVSEGEWFSQGNMLNTLNFSILDFIGLKTMDIDKKVSKDWEEIPDEMFHSLWTPGRDENENKFLTEFRMRELQRIIRKCEIKAESRRMKTQTKIACGLLGVCLATFAMSMGNQIISM